MLGFGLFAVKEGKLMLNTNEEGVKYSISNKDLISTFLSLKER